MVADLVAIPRQSSVLTGAPRSPEPLDRAGTIRDSSSELVDVSVCPAGILSQALPSMTLRSVISTSRP